MVEPTGPFEDDPDVTDKRFPGNPTAADRLRQPLRVVGEAVDWHDPGRVVDGTAPPASCTCRHADLAAGRWCRRVLCENLRGRTVARAEAGRTPCVCS